MGLFGKKNRLYNKKTLWCRTDKKKIFGELWLPQGDGPFPIIIYCHGCGMNNALLSHEGLAKAGIAVYAFDFGGGCPWSNTAGELKEMSAMTEAEDLRTVAAFLAEQDYVDQNRIYLMGFDLGGLVATMVAGEAAREESKLPAIAGLILFGPSYQLVDFQKIFLGGMPVPDTVRFSNVVLGRKFVEDIRDYDIYGDMARFRGPVILYVGEDDELVPLPYFERASKTFSDCRYHVVPVAGHVMLAGIETEIMAEIVNMILK